MDDGRTDGVPTGSGSGTGSSRAGRSGSSVSFNSKSQILSRHLRHPLRDGKTKIRSPPRPFWRKSPNASVAMPCHAMFSTSTRGPQTHGRRLEFRQTLQLSHRIGPNSRCIRALYICIQIIYCKQTPARPVPAPPTGPADPASVCMYRPPTPCLGNGPAGCSCVESGGHPADTKMQRRGKHQGRKTKTVKLHANRPQDTVCGGTRPSSHRISRSASVSMQS